MNRKIFLFIVTFCAAALIPASSVYCQVGQITLTDMIENSSVVLTGNVCADSALTESFIGSTSHPGYYRLGAKYDGHFYQVAVARVLKGNAIPDRISIYVTRDETHPGEIPGVLLDAGKQYLFFLNPRGADTAIAAKYRLPAFENYFPYLAGYGAVLLKGADALDVLKRTEEYLADRPPVPSSNIPVSELLDSLKAKTGDAFAKGWLGDEHFFDVLCRKIDNAKKRLQKQDSLFCNAIVQNYQNDVDKVYEKTLKKETEGKENDNRFVTADARNVLYNYAGYIIDRLPFR